MIFQEGISLKNLGSFRIGGRVKLFKEARNVQDLIGSVSLAKKQKEPVFILGAGTNILWSDGGFSGLVLRPSMKDIKNDGLEVDVGAGVLVSDLLEFLMSKRLSGLEWAGGLPGTLGGAIRGNAGAFGGETKDIIAEVTSLDMKTLKIVKRDNKSCQFAYRNSVFKASGREVVVWAKLRLKRGDRKLIREEIEKRINYRMTRHPMEHPNVGSIFKNVNIEDVDKKILAGMQSVIKIDPFPVVPTAYLIAEAGLKGVSYGGAMVSPKHSNFIVNVLDASSDDVKNLIKLVKSEIFRKFKVNLEEEILIF
ncbi:MAG: UDP-N-acetylmuramate dehydrogenase [Candidatus Colwellbacteria bacterium]|nr:UDP-N-acetylmuramate dehydrogenase [Candidatus Colwellbacteria bacterium]